MQWVGEGEGGGVEEGRAGGKTRPGRGDLSVSKQIRVGLLAT